MKIAIIIVRVLMGLLFLFSSISWFFHLMEEPEMLGAMKAFNTGLEASVYLMPVVKVIELLCGLALVIGRFVPLATVVIFPIVINILGVHLFLEPDGLPVAIFLTLGNLFLAYYHRAKYAPMLAAK